MRISVVIPCFDAEDVLADTVRSVLNQTLPPHEILIADDGSTDGSVALAEGFSAPVRVLRGPFGGAPAARAAAAAEAQGEALMFLDADDLLGPDVVQSLSEALPPGGMSRCRWLRYEKAGAAWIAAPASCAPRRPAQDDLSAWLTGWYVPPCGLLWSREAYERSGGWDAGVAVNNDGDVVMRALTAGIRIAKARGGTSYYRRVPGSLSSSRNAAPGVKARLDVLERIEDRLGARKRRYRFSLAEAYRLIAAGAEDDALAAEADERARRLTGSAHRLLAAAHSGAARTGRFAESRMPLPPMTRSADSAASGSDARPLVSVVIPTHERPALTVRAVRSVLAQSHQNLEVLVVDDASTDDTVARVAAIGDARLRVLRQEVNRGVAAARNRGLREARGEFIALLDSDDTWLPRKIEAQLERFRRSGRRLGLVLTSVEERSGEDGAGRVRTPDAGGDLYRRLLCRNVLHGFPSSGLMRREIASMIGGFDESWPAIEDWDYVVRLSRFWDVAVVAEPLTLYDEDAESEEARRSKNLRANLRARRMFHARYGFEMRRAGTEADFLIESARRELREAGGDAAEGRRLVLQALAARPQSQAAWPFLAYMMAPGALRDRLRRIDPRRARLEAEL
ncbi:glycosyltransferase family 2 protein [Parvularcula oceani]|uniref:glycosyltransferase family 2 protein n=1 Tax=Parvularcula oceani TaxID=1247963 RepID=UPI00068CCB73|nr:glycosyltransferase [Parvularcula oceani]